MTATTFTELADEIKTAALNEVQSVKNTLVSWEHSLVPAVEADLVLVLGQFKTLAINLVTTFATQEFANLTGAQKNTITAQTVFQAAIAAGKPIALQDAAMLSQQAYNAVLSAVAVK